MSTASNLKQLSLSILCGYGLDALIVAAAWAIFDLSGTEAFYFFLALYGIYFFVWLKNSIGAWSLFLLTGPDALADKVLDTYKKNSFPLPFHGQHPEDYLISVIDAPDVEQLGKYSATSLYALLDHLSSTSEVQKYFRLTKVLTIAQKKYSQIPRDKMLAMIKENRKNKAAEASN